MLKLKPLSEILEGGVPKCTQEKTTSGNTDRKIDSFENNELLINRGGVLNVPSVPKEKIGESVENSAGEAIAKSDVSRAKIAYESSHEACGMIKCSQCIHWRKQCRHPTLHKGLWVERDECRWRRCKGFETNSLGDVR